MNNQMYQTIYRVLKQLALYIIFEKPLDFRNICNPEYKVRYKHNGRK